RRHTQNGRSGAFPGTPSQSRLRAIAARLRILGALAGPEPETPEDHERRADRDRIEKAFLRLSTQQPGAAVHHRVDHLRGLITLSTRLIERANPKKGDRGPPHSAPSAEAVKSRNDGCRPGEECWRYSRMAAYIQKLPM